jgi:predicted ABC-type ATPase
VNEPAPTIYLIGGCNGAGKTTFAREFLTTELKNLRFLNPDEIARGLSPFDPAEGLFHAGRILIEQFRAYVEQRETFTFESTLSGKTYVKLLRDAVGVGYEVEIHYLLLPNPELAIQRVKARVRMGGHDVPEEDVRRRFFRSRQNFVKIYLPMATRWVIWNASVQFPTELANSAENDMGSVRKLLE